ncbi:MAG: lysophospholipid acyltransferase family protein [Candidatus Kariarchaeaceae archaeon]|jgi:1-acyl-sn-glycerol-3-phosphate acyltransferase
MKTIEEIKAAQFDIKEYTYRSAKGIFKAILRFSYAVSSEGLFFLEQLDKGQGFLMAANHGSIVDAFVMGLEVNTHKIRFVGRQRTLWGNPIFGKINNVIGTIPVPERKAGSKSSVIDSSVQALREGAAVGIYPEGAILNRRKKFEGKTGTARMALEAGVPVLPVGLIGTDGLWPYGAKMPRLGVHVEMIVGPPLYFEKYHGMQDNFEVVNYVRDVIMREIRRLSGWYAVPPEHIIKWHTYYRKLVPPKI